ncbi:MAG: type II toxin-antitoxin system VapB family antitoxin [Deltaproteobacteria bacterium]|nr:type II toxin-antitoxin system VapB family antitoxin [Deltaproteobacteria bacterium]
MAKALTSLRLDNSLVRKAQRILGANNRTETVEMSLKAVVEIEKHRKLIKRYGGKAKPGDFDHS